ncbi:N-acetyltransferase family protein [Nocardia salmonicida]
MNAPVLLRRAEAADAEPMRAIYNHAVRHSNATLDTVEKTPAQMADWLAAHSGRDLALVAVRSDRIVGYGTLSPFAARGGYFPSTEISIYLDPDARAVGIGSELCSRLIDFARAQGYTTVIAFVTDTNIAPIRMIHRLGFRRTGLLEHIGYKLGQLVNLEIHQLTFPGNLKRYNGTAHHGQETTL